MDLHKVFGLQTASTVSWSWRRHGGHTAFLSDLHYTLCTHCKASNPATRNDKKRASATYGVCIWKTMRLWRCGWKAHTLLEGSCLGFPRGTTTPSLVTLASDRSGAVWPTPFVLHQDNWNQMIVHTFLSTSTQLISRGYKNMMLCRMSQGYLEPFMWF